MEFSTVTIAAFVGILNELTKSIAKDVFKKDINRFIPIFSLIYGVALSIIGYNIGRLLGVLCDRQRRRFWRRAGMVAQESGDGENSA